VYTIGVMTKREEELLAAGWERRFIATEPRLREAIELYEEIGFEVLLERERYRIIYTRAKEARES
jgi:ribosomal protein S18 acetylase RimI-like enzyme